MLVKFLKKSSRCNVPLIKRNRCESHGKIIKSCGKKNRALAKDPMNTCCGQTQTWAVHRSSSITSDVLCHREISWRDLVVLSGLKTCQ